MGSNLAISTYMIRRITTKSCSLRKEETNNLANAMCSYKLWFYLLDRQLHVKLSKLKKDNKISITAKFVWQNHVQWCNQIRNDRATAIWDEIKTLVAGIQMLKIGPRKQKGMFDNGEKKTRRFISRWWEIDLTLITRNIVKLRMKLSGKK